ncbi:DUF3019 domain-containing protein [Shewanella sp. SR44-3]|nr:DUF3019 domain-containing protein [Shewanella sp. SR44-3]
MNKSNFSLAFSWLTALFHTVIFAMTFTTTSAWGQDKAIAFTATPERCVALHKGQICYQEVLFRWQTPSYGEYCLVMSKSGRRITCWDGASQQEYHYSFEGDKTTSFSLVADDKADPLARVKVVVTWVYKAPKQSQSGWRLF